jgi:hypothetical protein
MLDELRLRLAKIAIRAAPTLLLSDNLQSAVDTANEDLLLIDPRVSGLAT